MNFSNLRSRHVAFLLLIFSLVLYGLDYLLFGGMEGIAAGFLANLAFLPLYVLFVTLIIERVVRERERFAIRQKLNMVIGVFFSEVGSAMIRDCLGFVRDARELEKLLRIDLHWTPADFKRATGFLQGHDIGVDSREGDLTALKEFLAEKRGFLLGLLGNPSLMEHDEFTDLLWAVSHLSEELGARRSLAQLSAADLEHLSGDIKRAYGLLLREWVVYMLHLKEDYPYLFSLAVRMNPLNAEARAEIA
ncbi:MAG TPA: hypothetical protein VI298_04820 [Geobacteraceae bacterium]